MTNGPGTRCPFAEPCCFTHLGLALSASPGPFISSLLGCGCVPPDICQMPVLFHVAKVDCCRRFVSH